jgi:hypothetical protein
LCQELAIELLEKETNKKNKAGEMLTLGMGLC